MEGGISHATNRKVVGGEGAERGRELSEIPGYIFFFKSDADIL